MGAFNTVTAEAPCPVCGRQAAFEVQFKYGETWQHAYVLGDALKWGGTGADRGTPGHRRVLVRGIGSRCPHCGSEDKPFTVTMESDRVASVDPLLGNRIGFGGDDYAVVEP